MEQDLVSVSVFPHYEVREGGAWADIRWPRENSSMSPILFLVVVGGRMTEVPPASSLYPSIPPPSLDRLVRLIEATRSAVALLGDGEKLLVSVTKFLLPERDT